MKHRIRFSTIDCHAELLYDSESDALCAHAGLLKVMDSLRITYMTEVERVDNDGLQHHERVFGEENMWKSLKKEPVPIGHLTDEHLKHCVLWIMKILSRHMLNDRTFMRPGAVTRYLVRKLGELGKHCYQRNLCVPVGAEPPDPTSTIAP